MITPLIKLIFLRHGNTFETHEIPVYIGSKTNLSLTQKGQEQAKNLCAFLTNHALIPDHIYSGPLKRHLETAQILSHYFDLPIIETPALNEIDYEQWEGKTQEELKTYWPDAYTAWCDQALWPKNIFNVKNDLYTHQQALIHWLDKLCFNAEPPSTVVAITSNGLLKILLTLVPDLALELFETHRFNDYKVKTGGACILEYNTFSKKLNIKKWNAI